MGNTQREGAVALHMQMHGCALEVMRAESGQGDQREQRDE